MLEEGLVMVRDSIMLEYFVHSFGFVWFVALDVLELIL